ncbi:MAG: hypothetical protein IKE21_07060 [Erysipelotrichaceae bacterium]|nr:hypothetical protein [Erysipelotrichaceae bacterium]
MSRQREIAYSILQETLKGEKYANLQMQKELQQLPFRQRPFVTELVNGVLRNYLWLQYQFTDLLKKEPREDLKILLCMAFYERFVLKEKDYALNNEYVSMASEKEKGFVNALLRKRTAERELPLDSLENRAVKASLPLWIVRLWQKQFSEEEFAFLLEDCGKIPPLTYRRNPRKASKEDLEALGAVFEDDYAFTCKENLLGSEAFKNGWCYVQDRNAMKIAEMLELQEESTLLDVCSAPGAKFFNCLETVRPENAYSNDANPLREDLVRKKAKQLGIEGAHYLSHDGRKLPEVLDREFDRILLDAPCSGLGVLKRKPDLRYRLQPSDLDDLQKLQKELLEGVSPLLKEGGILLYSTCTLNRKENEKQIASFLQAHPEYVLLEEKRFLYEEGDHFYCAKLQKREV